MIMPKKFENDFGWKCGIVAIVAVAIILEVIGKNE